MSLLHHAPRFDASAARSIVHEHYGIEGSAAPLPSERDQNFLLTAADGRRLVLKIANATEDRALLDAQNGAMVRVSSRAPICPVVIPTRAGTLITERRGPAGASHFVRLLTWLDGTPFGSTGPHGRALFTDLGRKLGTMDEALGGFDHPALHRDFHWDLAQGFDIVRRHVHRVDGPELKALVISTVATLEPLLAPLVPRLPRSVIHGDANDYNVIVSRPAETWAPSEEVAGFIDFGDMVHSYTVADLAVAVAYAVLDEPDPLAIASLVTAGYRRTHALAEEEIAAIVPLAQLRLCMSVCLAADQQAQRPADEYLGISQGPIARTLPRLAAIPAGLALAALRHACGLDPAPGATRAVAWLKSWKAAAVLETVAEGTAIVDLSVGSPLVDGDPLANSEPDLTARIDRAMREAAAAVGIGRYGEPRLLYSSSLSAATDSSEERRTIHLGVDLFAPAGMPVHAPIDGVVHIAADNAQPLDYGPVIVLRHAMEGDEPFFTLYGHLSRESLAASPPGRAVRAGEAFAAIGDAGVNGGWTPHLHFQLVSDLLGLGRDFPGVCRASERAAWMAISPDPSALLRVGDAAFPEAALDVERALAARRELIGANLSVAYREPVQVVRGWKQYLYDATGRRYLDAYNNVPHVGHGHPRVVRAAADQMRVLNTNTRYVHRSLERYAERLVATLPDPLRVCYFVNSGTEANELALRLAHAHTRARDVIVLEAAYHGNSSGLIALSPYKFYGPGGEGAQPWVHVAPVPDVYRGAHKAADTDAASKYAASVAEIVARLDAEERPLCAFIAETCPSVAGQILLPPGYLSRVYLEVRRAGGVCIADEVQTAYGRMGDSFYAFEPHGVVPDIVVLGKPIGNGYPLGAVITTREIAGSFDNGMEFFSTFGGSTVSCVVGLAVLDVVFEEQLQAHAARVGDRMLRLLRDAASRHPLVGDVRGSGLFIGIELVRDPDTLEPATEEAAYVADRMRELGILLGTDGPSHNVIKIRPPMPFDAADAERLVNVMDEVLSELTSP